MGKNLLHTNLVQRTGKLAFFSGQQCSGTYGRLYRFKLC